MKKDQHQLNWLMVSLIAFNMVWGARKRRQQLFSTGDFSSRILGFNPHTLLYPIFTHRRTTRFYLQGKRKRC